jgi:3-oxoacyl-[acyl-carrier protein] reductase
MFNLNNKSVVVTGSGQGLGKTIAEEFIKSGAQVCIAELNPVLGKECEADLNNQGSNAFFFQVDVSDEKQVQSCVEAVKTEFGRIDILINNAGIRGYKNSLDVTETEWDSIVKVNHLSVFICSQLFGREMIRQGTGGSIVNISSIASLSTFPMRAGYGTTKSAINQLTKILAIEWARHNIRVNSVAPGMIFTEMFNKMVEAGILDIKALQNRIPLGRISYPAEIANVVLFLSSEMASYVTGQTWFVDGGWTVRGAYSFINGSLP